MSKVITFSRVFPPYHQRAGEDTKFIEGFWQSLFNQDNETFMPYLESNGLEKEKERFTSPTDFYPKGHTVRAGHRFKAGDFFSPRVWSGKPYNSKQITFAPDTLISHTYDFELQGGKAFIHDWREVTNVGLLNIANNDGLSLQDFTSWFHDFSKPFSGQIIIWDKRIKY